MESDECVPALMTLARGGKQVGDLCGVGAGIRKARKELIRREGPPPFPGAVCRHLPDCENDSTAPNGFVCVKHTVWGTASENRMDQSPEDRKRGGRIAAESGRLKEAARLGGNTSSGIERTCPNCGRVIRGPGYFRHFERCRHRPPCL